MLICTKMSVILVKCDEILILWLFYKGILKILNLIKKKNPSPKWSDVCLVRFFRRELFSSPHIMDFYTNFVKYWEDFKKIYVFHMNCQREILERISPPVCHFLPYKKRKKNLFCGRLYLEMKNGLMTIIWSDKTHRWFQDSLQY